MLVTRAECVTCGAPFGFSDGQRVVICAYCNTSLLIEVPRDSAQGPAGALQPVSASGIPPEEIGRVKQMAIEGKRDEAIAHYAQLASVSIPEATKAVDDLVLFALSRLLRNAPIHWGGWVLTGVVSGGFGLLAWWSLTAALEGTWWLWIVAAIAAFLSVLQLIWFVPKVISTIVLRFGSEGRAVVVKRTVLKPGFQPGGTLLKVLLEVTPSRGGASFMDEEVLLVHDRNVEKLVPGNAIMVRYDEPDRKRVFPVQPMTVLSQ